MFAKFYLLSQTYVYAMCSALAQVAWVILAHAASRMTFHGYFKSTCIWSSTFRHRCLCAWCWCTRTFSRQDLKTLEVNKFFSKFFFLIFSKKNFFSKTNFSLKKSFFKNIFLFQIRVFFSKKKNFTNFFFQKPFFKSFFPNKKKFFIWKSFTLIEILMFSKLFIWHLSRRIVRTESAGKGGAIGKSLAVIGWKGINERTSFVYNLKLYKNSFCWQRARLEVLIKVTSKADRWKERGKSFTKNWFLIVFFSIIKNVFRYMLAKFFYQIQMHAISSLQSQILRHMGMGCLCNIGAHSKLCDVSWLFWVYLYQTIQYKVFRS